MSFLKIAFLGFIPLVIYGCGGGGGGGGGGNQNTVSSFSVSVSSLDNESSQAFSSFSSSSMQFPDADDSDLDGDGVSDEFDAFPLDPDEWQDVNENGIGDNDDPYMDSSFLSELISFIDDNGIVYFSPSVKWFLNDSGDIRYLGKIQRFSILDNKFLSTVILEDYNDHYGDGMWVYAPMQHSIYHFQLSGDNYRYSLSDNNYVSMGENSSWTYFVYADSNHAVYESDVDDEGYKTFYSYGKDGSFVDKLTVSKLQFLPSIYEDYCDNYVGLNSDGSLAVVNRGGAIKEECALGMRIKWPLFSQSGNYYYLKSSGGIHLKDNTWIRSADAPTSWVGDNMLYLNLPEKETSHYLVLQDINGSELARLELYDSISSVDVYVSPSGNYVAVNYATNEASYLLLLDSLLNEVGRIIF